MIVVDPRTLRVVQDQFCARVRMCSQMKSSDGCRGCLDGNKT